MEKRYSNDDITIVWKPDACIHSTLCWRGLIAVFNPRNRPWINLDGADNEAIIAQVEKCPSGALSWHRKNDATEMPDKVEVETIVEVTPNGPLMVYGNIKVKDAEGNETTKHKVTAFCRCGGSGNKPYCDGPTIKLASKDKVVLQKGAAGCYGKQPAAFLFLKIRDLETNAQACVGVERVAFRAIFA